MANLLDLDGDRNAARPPSTVRYRVLFVTFLTAVLLYLDRFCMTYAQRYIKEDLRLSDAQIEYCLSAFFLAYSLAQVPSGGLTDRFGSRAMLTIYVLAWSFFTAAMGWVGGFAGLFAVRLAAGLSQAGAYPTGARVVAQWAPLTQRGVANSIIALGGRVGGAIAPILTAILIIAFVPASTTPLLESDDVLDVQALAALIEQADPAAAGEPLTDDSRAATAVTRHVRESLTDIGRRALSLSNVDDRETLRHELNRIIEQGLAIPNDQLVALPLEREARWLLDKSEPLAAAERSRLTRLVLEAVFPKAIRKLYVRGWRPVMWSYGLMGIVVAAWFWWQVRDRASQHPRVNELERQLLLEGQPHVQDRATAGRVPLGAILANRSLWLLSVSAFGTNVGWVFLVTLLDRYLYEVHRVPFVDRGVMQSIPLFVGWAGMMLGGWWTDRLVRRRGIKVGRALPIAFSRFLAMAAFAAMLLHPSAWVCTAFLALVAFGTDLGSPAIWAVTQDVGGRSVAAVLGWGNMWGNFGAVLSPILLGWVSREWSWDAAFIVCGSAFLVAGIASALVDASRPIEPVD